jgi:hypothetical protein
LDKHFPLLFGHNRCLLGAAPALPLAMAQFFMAGRPDSDRA